MKQVTIFTQMIDNNECLTEMISCLLDKHYLEEVKDGYRWRDTKEFLGERKDRAQKVCMVCPDCGSNARHPTPDCDMVYGRRGWRQLGVYDG